MHTVAYQGVLGSFSSMAARALFGADFIPLHTTRFREIFEHVASGRAAFGVVPVENALAGSVHENFDLLAEFSCAITAEYYCPVQLHLMVLPGTPGDVAALRTVVSHPKALEQCSNFLERHPHLTPTQFSDTAGAAQHLHTLPAHHSPGESAAAQYTAAIASAEAASTYGLTIIANSIQNHPFNATRFIAISATPAPVLTAPPPNKGSFIVTLPHVPGSLCRLLATVAELGCNLTKIESRPIPGKPFEYLFHIDIQHGSDHTTSLLPACIERLRATSSTLRVLGVYRAAADAGASTPAAPEDGGVARHQGE